MKYDLISFFPRSVVFMESKKIDLNKQGIKIKTTELGYKRKQYDELRKVSKLKDHNLIQANYGLDNILMLSVFVRYQWFTKLGCLLKDEKNASSLDVLKLGLVCVTNL